MFYARIVLGKIGLEDHLVEITEVLEIEETIGHLGKCIKQYAPNVRTIVKYLLSQHQVRKYYVRIVLEKTMLEDFN